jgi:putative salt-induced outer membrane protein
MFSRFSILMILLTLIILLFPNNSNAEEVIEPKEASSEQDEGDTKLVDEAKNKSDVTAESAESAESGEQEQGANSKVNEENSAKQEDSKTLGYIEPEKDIWNELKHKLNIEGSLSMASGNTENENLRGDLDLVSTLGKWKNEFEVEASNQQQDGLREQEYYRINNKLKKEISDKRFAYGEFTYEDDRFAGIDYRFTETLGIGQYFIKEKDLKISADIGIGARQTNFLAGAEDEEGFLGTFGFDAFWRVNENTEFNQEIDVNHGSENTETLSETSLKTFIDKNLYLKLAYEFRNNSDVPAGKKNTDTQFIVTVGYQLGEED